MLPKDRRKNHAYIPEGNSPIIDKYNASTKSDVHCEIDMMEMFNPDFIDKAFARPTTSENQN